ncbi:MAG TPA: hypothetical protein VFW83_00630 [Bryobacteraceae bacterium]|nr:hypothetical protein [Bryobacteraceae bacterium]
MAAAVAEVLEGYAARGIFRGFGKGPAEKSKASFQLIWHYDRRLDLILNAAKRTLTFPELLPGIPAGSGMYREYKKFLAERHSDAVPAHRRIDMAKARVTCSNRRGSVAVAVTIQDCDWEYATRKLINTADETVKDFLGDGPYFDYLVDHMGLDPDRY